MKRKKKGQPVKYQRKRFNYDTIELNILQTTTAIGICAPEPIDPTRLKRKPRKREGSL